MNIDYKDFNGATKLLDNKYKNEWNTVNTILSTMPLHLKASDQKGIQGKPIFDTVGSNAFIKKELNTQGWSSNVSIPKEFSFLGTDVDFARRGLLLEVQFSNYPFLLNNVVRSDIFLKSGLSLDNVPVEVIIIITKAHMFPSSNSTLYYEQAIKQLSKLEEFSVLDAPIRVVGLKEPVGRCANVLWTEYKASRYSRTVKSQNNCSCNIMPGRNSKSRCTLKIPESSC